MADEGKQASGDAWGDDINDEWKAELRAAYEANVKAGRWPYVGVHFRSREELLWIAQARNWWAAPSASGEDANQPIWGRSLADHADFRGVNLANVDLSGARLLVCDFSNANLHHTNLSGADLFGTNLSGAMLVETNLRSANLMNTDLRSTQLVNADLTKASLFMANLSGASLIGANLSGASLVRARLDGDTDLTETRVDAHTCLADVKWGSVSLSRVRWAEANTLGDEDATRQPNYPDGKHKDNAIRLDDYQNAVVAYRQVSTVLRSQGLDEHADRFSYRAQVLQREALWRQTLLREKGKHVGLGQRLRKLAAYLGSGLLDLVAGYGYRPGRSIVAYIVIICAFAGLFLLNGQFASPHLRWDEALVLSISSFHGRGFFTSGVSLGDTLARLAAGEAIVGLLLEITFIATFTNRFFAR